jgi:iron(III) transport system substrate-binding protein
MNSRDRGRFRTRAFVGIVVVLALVLVGVVVAATSSSGDRLTIYSARSHYGEEKPFKDFAKQTGEDLTLFGGSASELYERIRNEGAESKADLLVTVDAANLWRAKEAGLLQPVTTPGFAKGVPAELRDPDGAWVGLTVRARTIMRSTERVDEDAVTTYEGLGDPRWKGKLCLRSGTSEYNVSFVADRLAKDGEAATRRMLERWMANEPEILGSDVDVLEAIEAGRCDLGLTNTYYLGRKLAEDPDFPVAPVYADQKGRGTHVNLSGVGVVKWARHRGAAVRLVEFLTRPEQQGALASSNHEFAAAEGVQPTEQIGQFGEFKRDPIDVAAAGERLDDALQLMGSVGWN